MRNALKRFKNDTGGNISVMFAASFTASLIVIGAALDTMMIHQSQSKLQNLSDAAALAALKYNGDSEEKEAMYKKYLYSTAEASGYTAKISTSGINFDQDDKTLFLKTKVTAEHDLMMLHKFSDFDKVAAVTRAEIGIEDVEIALVLDISSSMKGARIEEAVESASFFIDELLSEDSLHERIVISLIPFGGTVRVPAGMQGILEEPSGGFGPYSENWIDGKWNQCFEYTTTQVKNGIDLNSTYKATPDMYYWNEPNPWCPTEGNELVPLTDDQDVLKARLDTLSLSDGTGSDHGMLWGYETLNPDKKNKLPGGMKDTPTDDTSTTKKVIIFMSDGGITNQHFVEDIDPAKSPPYYTYKKQLSSYSRANALDAFYSVCDKAKDQDIEVFSIGYLIKSNGIKTQLRNCASTDSHYIDAASGNLEEVFANIASTISPLRLSN